MAMLRIDAVRDHPRHETPHQALVQINRASVDVHRRQQAQAKDLGS
jgi:hypothetical protein